MEQVGQLEVGAVFANDYRVVRLLAVGGMGAVYVVDQLSTGKARALKVIRPELAGDEDLRRRFREEARIGSKVDSEHVVEIHSAGIDEATRSPYLVMELLDGESLDARLERGGPLPPAEVYEVFEQLCHAVSAAHAAGIVHRDLKPENVFLARSRRAGEGKLSVKVLDFGIAKLVEQATARGQTVGMIGTPLWMAPEQADRGVITPAADVWALGLILYTVVTGRSYWLAAADPEATFTQLMKEVVLGPLPAATARATQQGVASLWPPPLDRVFSASVVRDPRHRYADASAFWTALRDALGPASRDSSRALVPSSARVRVGQGPVSGLEQTAAPPAPIAPIAPLPPVTPFGGGPPLLGGSSTPTFEVAGVPLRPVLAGLIGLVVLGSVVMCGVRRRASTRDHELAAKTGEEAPAPNGVVTVGRLGAPAAPATARCRLCSGDVVVSAGGLSREAVVKAVEASFPLLDAQCLEQHTRSKRRVGAGVTTLSFVVREGKATERGVAASTSRDGADECLSRALSDVTFPVVAEGTPVSYTLSYNPSMR